MAALPCFRDAYIRILADVLYVISFLWRILFASFATIESAQNSVSRNSSIFAEMDLVNNIRRYSKRKLSKCAQDKILTCPWLKIFGFHIYRRSHSLFIFASLFAIFKKPIIIPLYDIITQLLD